MPCSSLAERSYGTGRLFLPLPLRSFLVGARGRPLSCALNKQLVSDASELITSAGGPARDLPHFSRPDGITDGPTFIRQSTTKIKQIAFGICYLHQPESETSLSSDMQEAAVLNQAKKSCLELWLNWRSLRRQTAANVLATA